MKRMILGIAAVASAALAHVAVAAAVPLSEVRARLPEDEVIYFLLPDRFENGDPRNDRGGLKGDRLKTGFDPDPQGLLPRRRPQGADRAARLSPGHGDHRGVARAGVQEQAGAGAAGAGIVGLSRLLDHRLHPGRSAPWHQRRLQGLRRRRACARDEGLYGHHRQPHRRRDPVSRNARARAVRLSLDRAIIRTSAAAARRARRSTRVSPATSTARRAISRGSTDPNFAYDGRGPGGGEVGQGARLAQRPDLVSQSRQHAWFAAKARPRRLRRARRSDDRESARRAGDDRDLSAAGSTAYGDRRLPHRHRAARQSRILAGVRARDAERARRRAASPISTSSAKSITDAIEPGIARGAHARRRNIPRCSTSPSRAAVKTRRGRRGHDEHAGERCSSATRCTQAATTTARQLPTFLSNHDAGRFAMLRASAPFPRPATTNCSTASLLGHAMLLTLRGVPTIYSGDEQGFVGDGGDQDAREDMFASKVAGYNDNKLLGSDRDHRDGTISIAGHPLVSRDRHARRGPRRDTPALRRGRQNCASCGRQARACSPCRGSTRSTGNEVLLLFNTSTSRDHAECRGRCRQACKFIALAGQLRARRRRAGQRAGDARRRSAMRLAPRDDG